MSRRGRRRGPQTGPRPDLREQQAQAQEAMDRPMLPLIRGRQLDLGDLSGEQVDPITAEFVYFGKTFRVNPDLSETQVVDLLEEAEEVDVDDPRNLLAAKDYVRGHLHPDDFDDFWDTAQANRQGVPQVVKVCWRILELITDRPTPPPSDSADGRRETPTKSLAGASGPVGGRSARELGETFVAEYEAQGRPDLAAQVMLAVEARERRGLVTV
jgi:hypothetical protein